jgi:hypothetical protein
VGNKEALFATIRGRADAVYLGVGKFNAHQGAKNFNLKDLDAAVKESLGVTPFEAAFIEIEADENIFVLIGVLKNARRKVADLLLEKILSAQKKKQKHPNLEDLNYLCSSENDGSSIRENLMCDFNGIDMR